MSFENTSPALGFVVLYRWRLHPGSEDTYYFSILVTDETGDTAARNYALTVAAPS